MEQRDRRMKSTITTLILMASPLTAVANGLSESHAWQFQTTADKANKAAVVDLIERKKGGFYDGFDTYTYIGSQVNCTNSANATANIAENGQAGPSTESNGQPTIDAVTQANADSTSAGVNGPLLNADDTVSQNGNQSNSGNQITDLTESFFDTSLGSVRNGSTQQDIENDQFNSGNQDAAIDTSTACNFAGARVSGTVNASEHLN
jgi:hypothetical protein